MLHLLYNLEKFVYLLRNIKSALCRRHKFSITSHQRNGVKRSVRLVRHCGGRRASGTHSQIISELKGSHVSDMLRVICHCRDVPWRVSTGFTDARGASLQCHPFSYKCVIFAADFSPTARLCPPPTSPIPTITTSSSPAWPPSESRCGSAPPTVKSCQPIYL